MSQPIKIVTHPGKFHNDDVLAVATIIEHISPLPYEIIRTRDVIEPGDGIFIVDVGRVYSPSNYQFDHHQSDCNETFHGSEVPMASAGMVWKRFGFKLCDRSEWARDYVYKRLFEPIDAQDNWVQFDTQPMFQVEHLNTAWDSESNGDSEFLIAVEIARTFLRSTIARGIADFKCESMFTDALLTSAEPILVLPQFFPWMQRLGNNHNFKLCVFRDKTSREWRISTIPQDVNVQRGPSRGNLPKEWVDNPPPLVTFVHKGLFLMGVDTDACWKDVVMIADEAISRM